MNEYGLRASRIRISLKELFRPDCPACQGYKKREDVAGWKRHVSRRIDEHSDQTRRI